MNAWLEAKKISEQYPDSIFIQNAYKELIRVNLFSQEADYEGMLGLCIFKTVVTFATEYGHSGGSAEVGADALNRLLRQKTL